MAKKEVNPKKEPKIDNLVKLYTLLLLKKEAIHGYDIIKTLRFNLNKSISPSHIYPFLKELTQNNLIEVKEQKERKKKLYILTDKGEEFTNLTLNKLDHMLDIALKQKLTNCDHCNCKIYSNPHKETINNRELSFCCFHCAESFKRGL